MERSIVFGPEYMAQWLLATAHFCISPRFRRLEGNIFTGSMSVLVHAPKPLQGCFGLSNFPVLQFLIHDSSQISLPP